MSRTKLSLLIIGVIAVSGLVLTGAGYLAASSGDENPGSASSCAAEVGAKTASSCPASACAMTAGTSGGCASKASAAHSGKGCPASSSASCATPCGPKAAKTASIQTIGEREGARVVLVGHYACGRCELGVSEGCQPAFQTADGKNYLLIKNNLSKELHAAARDKDVEIVTRVKKLDGAKYLEVEVVRHAS